MTSVTENPDKGESEVRLLPLGPPRRSRMRIAHLMILVPLSGLALSALVAAVVAFGPAVIFPTVVVVVMLAIGAIVTMVRWHRSQQDALVWALAVASERGMPLAPALYAIAEQGGFFFRNRTIALADMLAYGASFPEALDRVPGVLPRDAEIMARVGWEAGALPGALRDAVAARAGRDLMWGSFFFRLAYLLGVLIAMQTVVGFIMYFVLPKFEAIFKDFGVPLPQSTMMVIEASHVVVRFGAVAFLVVACEVILLFLLPFAAGGWVLVTVPVLDRLFLRRHSAVILRALARLVEAGKPLPPGFATLARRYRTTWVRDKLRGVALDIDRGTDWCLALSYNGLINEADAAVLDSARRAGNLPWALRETAETGERRLAYRLQGLLQLLFPVLVLAVGGFVFIIAVAYFSPLVSLIQRLAG